MSEDESENQTDPRFYELRKAAYSDPDRTHDLIASDPAIVDARNSIDETALHFLVVEDEREAVEMLAANGSDVNCRNAFGDAAIMEAAQLGYVERR